MNYGGVIFRVVLPGTERDQSLDESAVMQDFRTEYLCEDCDPPRWTLQRDQAFRFPAHADAVARAKNLPGHCHVTVARDPNAPADFDALERERPAARTERPPKIERPAPPKAVRKTRPKKPRDVAPGADRLADLRAAHSRVGDRESREPFWYEKGSMA